VLWPLSFTRLETSAGRSSYQQSVAECRPPLARHPRDFSDYEQALGGAKLGAMTVRGNVAKVRVRFRNGKHVPEAFVRAAGQWRLLIGVQ
jgi:hypothetical protein